MTFVFNFQVGFENIVIIASTTKSILSTVVKISLMVVYCSCGSKTDNQAQKYKVFQSFEDWHELLFILQQIECLDFSVQSSNNYLLKNSRSLVINSNIRSFKSVQRQQEPVVGRDREQILLNSLDNFDSHIFDVKNMCKEERPKFITSFITVPYNRVHQDQQYIRAKLLRQHFMNFFKNTWKTLFKSEQSNQPSSSNTQQKPQPKTQSQTEDQQEQIPQQFVQELFTLSSELVKQSKNITNDQTKLKIYGLYKQAIQGDCNVDKPQMFDFIGKSKWAAWDELRGMSKKQAMMEYVKVVSQADTNVQKQIQLKFKGEEGEDSTDEKNKNTANAPKQSLGLKKVEQVDYSDTYSHPYFKYISKGQPIPEVKHELLLIINNEPAIYPLHFAIDRQRSDIVKQFLQILTKQQIEIMKDAQGTTILEYAQCMQNDQILQMVQSKLKK